MDPLRLTDLPLTEDWNLFQPDMKGYIPPQQLQLESGFNDVKSQIRKFVEPRYMRDNDVPFLALSVEQRFPTTSLAIGGEKFTVPLSSREMAYLTGTVLGDAHASKNPVPGTELELLNDSGQKAIARVVRSALRKIDALRGGVETEKILATVDVFKAGSHELSHMLVSVRLPAVYVPYTNHGLPSAILIYVRLRSATSHRHRRRMLPSPPKSDYTGRNLMETVSAIGTYTGVSDGRIDIGAGGEIICLTYYVFGPRSDDARVIPRLENVSGVLPPLRDAFCLWRHYLNLGADATTAPPLMLFLLDCAPLAAREFQKQDATLLCHLASLAKAYGFTMYIGNLEHTMTSTEQEVYHDPKDYLDLHTDFDPKPELLELATVSSDDGGLMDICPDEDYDILSDDICIAKVALMHRISRVIWLVFTELAYMYENPIKNMARTGPLAFKLRDLKTLLSRDEPSEELVHLLRAINYDFIKEMDIDAILLWIKRIQPPPANLVRICEDYQHIVAVRGVEDFQIQSWRQISCQVMEHAAQCPLLLDIAATLLWCGISLSSIRHILSVSWDEVCAALCQLRLELSHVAALLIRD
ncbi:hypothetical protein B0H11DRAFT_2187059 [Mycena galericulata]|nr:hypothetical protein B0H11DRAFT_2187059 [Mycena galericulata]